VEDFHCDVVAVVVVDKSVVKVYDDMEQYEMKTLVEPSNQQYHQVNYYHVSMVPIEKKTNFDDDL
jgi:hypothetical protein